MTTTCILLALATSATPSRIPEKPSGAAAETYRIVSRGHGPVGTVRFARPTFSWCISPQNGARITGSKITINGTIVPSRFDVERGEVTYTPAAALKRGDYKVKVEVEVAKAVMFRKEWTTVVPSDAVASLPAVREDQIGVFEVLNRHRVALGLSAFELDGSLCAAAESHAEYLAQNVATGHVQAEGTKGFTGVNPWDRTRAYGFSGGTWEAAGYEVSNSAEAVAAIFDAPYHRIPFLRPGTARVGVGTSERGTVIDGEIPLGTGTVTSPADGEAAIPLSWKGYERPDPLRHWPELQRPTGYPIVLADFVENGTKLEVASARLTLDGKEIRSYLATPAMDEHLTNAAILIPAKPLRKGSLYTVEMTARRDGRDLSRRWSFRTVQ